MRAHLGLLGLFHLAGHGGGVLCVVPAAAHRPPPSARGAREGGGGTGALGLDDQILGLERLGLLLILLTPAPRARVSEAWGGGGRGTTGRSTFFWSGPMAFHLLAMALPSSPKLMSGFAFLTESRTLLE